MSNHKTAVVTGASSGIGKETALALAARGYSLVLAARRADKLREVADACGAIDGSIRVEVIPTDVTITSQIDELISRTVGIFGRIDVMVNNAGAGMFARAHETTEEQMRWILDLNYGSIFSACRAVVPVMIAQGGGHIFNVSSVIGKRGSPFHGAYSAAKFAVCGLTESMRVELRPLKIHVTLVCPTLTATDFFAHSKLGPRSESPYLDTRKMMPASVVGKKIVATVGRNKPELVFSAAGKFLCILSALWPGAADRIMTLYHNDLARRL